MRELLKLPNLLSLSRIFLTPLVGYLLAQDYPEASWYCLGLFIVAAITDGLDGYFARKMKLISKLGIALDPVADKIFAGVLVILLIIYREFPLWLAFVIVGRDLLIVLGGFILLRGKDIVIPSNITGKYTFVAIAVLLASYVIQFPFGMTVMTYFTCGFTLLSLLSYTVVFTKVKKGEKLAVFKDTTFTRYGRLSFNVSFALYFIWRMYQYYL